MLCDGAALDRAILSAHRRVILRHRQLRTPLVIWRDGRIAEVDPESVELPEIPELPERDETQAAEKDRTDPRP
jgi:hypothetical protein